MYKRQGLAREYKRLVEIHGSSSLIPVYQERGVYNVYFRLLARDREPIFLTDETDGDAPEDDEQMTAAAAATDQP